MGQRLAGLLSDVQQHLRILKGLNKSATALRYFASDTADFFNSNNDFGGTNENFMIICSIIS